MTLLLSGLSIHLIVDNLDIVQTGHAIPAFMVLVMSKPCIAKQDRCLQVLKKKSGSLSSESRSPLTPTCSIEVAESAFTRSRELPAYADPADLIDLTSISERVAGTF